MVSESNDELYQALREGKLDGVVDDSPMARHFAEFYAEFRYVRVLDGTDGVYAVMVRKDNSKLRDEINSALGGLEAEGIFPSLRKQWFVCEDLRVV